MTALKNRFYDAIGVLGGYSISQKITHNHARILMYHRFGGKGEYRKTEVI